MWKNALDEVFLDFDKGLYSRLEVVSFCIGLFSRELLLEVWVYFPDWVRDGIKDTVLNMEDDDEVVTFGRLDSQQSKRDILRVKRWLIEYT